MTLSKPTLAAVLALCVTAAGCPDAETEDEGVRAEASILGVEVNENSEVEKYDLSGDGKADVWKYFSKVSDAAPRIKARTDRDFNWDGKVDSRQHFDPNGVMVREELDLDFDGRFDAIDYFLDGKHYKREQSFNFDAKPTIWKYYEDGQVVRKERDTNANGRADTFEFYEKGKLLRVGYDRDGDGKPDYFDQAGGT